MKSFLFIRHMGYLFTSLFNFALFAERLAKWCNIKISVRFSLINRWMYLNFRQWQINAVMLH